MKTNSVGGRLKIEYGIQKGEERTTREVSGDRKAAAAMVDGDQNIKDKIWFVGSWVHRKKVNVSLRFEYKKMTPKGWSKVGQANIEKKKKVYLRRFLSSRELYGSTALWWFHLTNLNGGDGQSGL